MYVLWDLNLKQIPLTFFKKHFIFIMQGISFIKKNDFLYIDFFGWECGSESWDN